VSLRQRVSPSWLPLRALQDPHSANVSDPAAKQRGRPTQCMITIYRSKWQCRPTSHHVDGNASARKSAERPNRRVPTAGGQIACVALPSVDCCGHFRSAAAPPLLAAPVLRAGERIPFMAGAAAFLNSASGSTNGNTFLRRPADR